MFQWIKNPPSDAHSLHDFGIVHETLNSYEDFNIMRV